MGGGFIAAWLWIRPIRRIREYRAIKKALKGVSIGKVKGMNVHGWKTYTGLAAIFVSIALRYFGADCTEVEAAICSQATDLVNGVVQVLQDGGALLATVGAVHKSIKLKNVLKAQ